ncbi:MAG: hypothetical protein IJ714_03190 [Bacteroidales bacterium]|jgi:hypothetical protein|nr:hypothetical protein [Bacteroidales bacterium]
MRKLAFFAAVAATLCTVACNKELPATTQLNTNPEAVQMAELKLSIVGNGGPQTKTWDGDFDDNHSAVANVQFFVFDGEVLDVYKKITSGLSTSMTVKTGDKTVWAVVNAPDISNITTLTQLKAISSTLMDNASYFVMVGSNTASVPSNDPIEIEVKRIVSRVVVKKVTAAFTNPAYAAMNCKLMKMFLINAPGNTNLEMTAAPTTWYCKRSYEEVSGLTSLLATYEGSHNLNNAPFETIGYHYCYPNPTTADSQSTTWSARHTRIVIEVQLGSDTFYYPITLPVLEPGKSYEIENLTITRKGSSDPDQPISLSDATFEISAKNWTVVPITEGITI